MIIAMLVGCAFHSQEADLSGFQGGRITFVKGGVLLSSATDCPRLASSVVGTLNGQPMQLVDRGGKYLGSSPDGLAPTMRCAEPAFSAGVRPVGNVQIELSDGVRRWSLRVADVEGPKTLSVTSGSLVSGKTVSLATTPASATWTLSGMRHSGNDLAIYPSADGQSEAVYRGCTVSVNGPDFTTASGPNEYGSLTAAGRSAPGLITFQLPEMRCEGAAELRYHGAVEQALSGCPADMTCVSWEEAEARVPVSWAATPAP